MPPVSAHADYDDAYEAESDSVSSPPLDLDELVITAQGARKVVDVAAESGTLTIDARNMADIPSLMGSNDAIGVLKSLPAVATPNDLQAALPVHGMPSAYTRFEADGIRLMNPLHMLGLYSAFNPEFFKSYRFSTSSIPATAPASGGALLAADSGIAPVTSLSGAVSIGLIESHFALKAPIVTDRLGVSLAARQSYLPLLFPDILQLGTSTLRYDFTDLNLSVCSRPSETDRLSASLFVSRDGMKVVNDNNGSKDGRFGWNNTGASLRWEHSRWLTTLYATRYANTFVLEEGGITFDLPSDLTQYCARTTTTLSDFTLAAALTHTVCHNQHNAASSATASAVTSFQGDLAANWRRRLTRRWTLGAGLLLSYYRCGHYNRILPQPRISSEIGFSQAATLFASYGRFVKTDRRVEETASGMPVDFFTLASSALPPEDTHAFAIGARGVIPGIGLGYSAEAYLNLMRHVGEYGGSLLNFTSAAYDPLDELADARGYAAGLSVMLTRSVGAVRGSVAYNLGRSRLKADRYGDSWFAASHDRLHDLSVSLTWQPWQPLTISGTFTHATGLPYTAPRYGYMIGENLICEYYPHNSSRLPDYNRLDLSATFTLPSKGRLRHIFNISVYNAAACRNVIFRYTSYSLSEGIRQRESVMQAVIPSFTYTLRF
ncbi:MAG: hypothetical protein K2O78_06060 [Muribaculaceae bacterium]|nr:hypothetical protein [Muribaculaceae bacterium]